MILLATHTHLYPGHRGGISGPAKISDIPADGDCVVEFSDGSASSARLSKINGDWQLCAQAYRSAAGTNIAKKCWQIDLEENDGGVEFRILKKTACPS